MVFNSFQKELGTFLKVKREKKGLSQIDVSKKVGFTTGQYVSNIERGKCSPSKDIIYKFIDLYNINENEVFKIIMASVKKDLYQRPKL